MLYLFKEWKEPLNFARRKHYAKPLLGESLFPIYFSFWSSQNIHIRNCNVKSCVPMRLYLWTEAKQEMSLPNISRLNFKAPSYGPPYQTHLEYSLLTMNITSSITVLISCFTVFLEKDLLNTFAANSVHGPIITYPIDLQQFRTNRTDSHHMALIAAWLEQIQ